MAIDLQNTLIRLSSKTTVLVAKYHALEDEKKRIEDVNVSQEEEIKKLKMDIERLRIDNEYLKIARSISMDSMELAKSKAVISDLVRDVDKCIAQLND
ncbi:MAG: hypothetical protein PHR45_02135 [Muribaculaceae bacterium]|nr:hypothetical protein [Muribaculaceae bacterium]